MVSQYCGPRLIAVVDGSWHERKGKVEDQSSNMWDQTDVGFYGNPDHYYPSLCSSACKIKLTRLYQDGGDSTLEGNLLSS
jgi:hypothetical protein